MRKFLSLIIIAISFSSCQEDVKFNNPSLQGLKDDVFWRANDVRAYVYPNGHLSIVAYTAYDQLTLSTGNTNEGKYILGTTDSNNTAEFTSTFNDANLEYATMPTTGPVYSVAILNGGTGYTSDCVLDANSQYVCSSTHDTTGGSGSGLTVSLVANSLGQVTSINKVATTGNGYLPGDVVTIASGDVNCTILVLNVQNSNGEIYISDYDNVNFTVTGEFKFNAINVDNNPLGGAVLNYQYGAFYKVPVFPAP